MSSVCAAAAPASRAALRRYAAAMPERDERVETLRRLLDAELERRIGAQWGCWPLLVAVLGVLLGLALLADRL